MLYAQINDEGICTCIGTPKTDIEVSDYSYLGKKRVWVETYDKEIETEVINKETGEPEISIVTITVLEHWEWQDVPIEPVPTQPTNAELAQLVSDLQADLLIAGVI